MVVHIPQEIPGEPVITTMELARKMRIGSRAVTDVPPHLSLDVLAHEAKGRAVRGNPGRMRVGTDLMEVSQVAASVAHFGDRYVRRLFTEHEIACCQGS